MSDLKEKLTEAATSLGERASGVAEDLRDRAEDAWDSAQRGSKRAIRKGSTYVHKNPVPTALAAFAFGLVLGLFLSRRHPASLTERVIAGPLHESKGMLLGLLIACGTVLSRAFSSASQTTGEIVEKVGGELQDSLKPLRKAAGKPERHLAF